MSLSLKINKGTNSVQLPNDWVDKLGLPHYAQDIYLYTAANMGSLGKNIIASGYDPLNPTPESISRAKKMCKEDRSIAKVVHLSSQYGAGAYKIHETLKLQKIDVTLNQCFEFHKAYWKTYQGVKEFEHNLKETHFENQGWIWNGFGRPLAVDNEKTKDLLNRFTQSTGHDILMMFLYILVEEAQDITWDPWFIDMHDETMVEVPEAEADKMVKAFERTYARLNDTLKWDVPIIGDIEVADNLADIKCED